MEPQGATNKPPQSEQQRQPPGCSTAVTVALVLASTAGGALLVWWALAFHPDDEQLWMVPLGLVVFGTPVVVWLSVFASGARRRLQPLWSAATGACATEDSGVVQHGDLEKQVAGE